LAARHLRQPLLLLLFGAVVEDVRRDDRAVQADAEAVDADMADRLEDRALMREGAARAAILFRHRGTQETVSARLQPALAIEDLVLLELLVMRHDLRLEEAGGHVVEHPNFLVRPCGPGKIENGRGICIHMPSSFPSPLRGGWPRSGRAFWRISKLTRVRGIVPILPERDLHRSVDALPRQPHPSSR